MKNIACGEVVTRAIMKCSSVDASKIQIDFTKRTVSVTYDSLITALKNIEFSIAEAGFQANEVPANEAAAKALPLECKLTGPN
jgi:copper chaperone CopZ